MLILESQGPLAGSQRPPFPPASEVHVGKPAPDRQNSQVGSPQPCATRPARLQPRALLPPSPLRGRQRLAFLLFLRRPKRAPTSGPLHVLPLCRERPSPRPSHGWTLPISPASPKSARLRRPFPKKPSCVFNSLHSMRRSHTLPDLLISSLLMSSARADAEESREACSPQGPPHLEDTQ